MSKQKVSEILHNTLNYAYCDNCDNNGQECDCNRKGQEWSLSKATADKLAEKIHALYVGGTEL